jgi:hypothetical protein
VNQHNIKFLLDFHVLSNFEGAISLKSNTTMTDTTGSTGAVTSGTETTGITGKNEAR